MSKNYKIKQSLKQGKSQKMKVVQLLRTLLLSVLIVLFTGISYGQCITGLNYSTTSCLSGVATLNAIVTGGGTRSLTYLWSLALTTGTATISNTALPNPTINGTASGNISLKVTDNATGCSMTATRTILKSNNTGPCISFGTATVTLPAVGLNLSGSAFNGSPVLTWSTLQEQNTSYFSVEASTDGTTFTSIGKVNAAGTSSSPSNYTFTDVTSVASLVYYRIKLVDIDGNISFSNIYTLRISGSSSAKVYPNPVTNLVNIETGAPGIYLAELFTVDGKKLRSTQLSSASGLITFNIDRANVASGIYLLKVVNKSSLAITYNTILIK